MDNIVSTHNGRHAMPCHIMSCHVMSCHVTSCHVMSCHGMLCPLKLSNCKKLSQTIQQTPTTPVTVTVTMPSQKGKACCPMHVVICFAPPPPPHTHTKRPFLLYSPAADSAVCTGPTTAQHSPQTPQGPVPSVSRFVSKTLLQRQVSVSGSLGSLLCSSLASVSLQATDIGICTLGVCSWTHFFPGITDKNSCMPMVF